MYFVNTVHFPVSDCAVRVLIALTGWQHSYLGSWVAELARNSDKKYAGPYPASDVGGGGSFDLKCGPMKTRQGNWGLVPKNFEINAVLAAWKSGPLWSWGGCTTGPTPPWVRAWYETIMMNITVGKWPLLAICVQRQYCNKFSYLASALEYQWLELYVQKYVRASYGLQVSWHGHCDRVIFLNVIPENQKWNQLLVNLLLLLLTSWLL